MNENYDIVVLGGGIGGYTAAVRAAQLGMKVAIVEKDKLGGTCLHRGCIPSKSLLRSAEVFALMKQSEQYGVAAAAPTLDFAKVRERKQRIVEQLAKGLEYLMKKNKIDVVRGSGRIVGPSIFSPKSGAVAVEKEDGDVVTVAGDRLIIATGSRPRALPGLDVDGEKILTSEDALQLEELPKSVLIIGGGVIGVEWASMLNDFGVNVTVVEAEKHLAPQEDGDISRELERLFKKRGIRFLTEARLLADTVSREVGQVSVEVVHKDKQMRLAADIMLVSVGRQPVVENIGLENTGVKVERGAIKVNEFMQTAESHIYAVGDVIGGLQLAHVAAHEGIVAVEHIAGLRPQPIVPHRVPRCIYSRPEIASIGLTEQRAKELGHDVKIGKFPFRALGKALVHGEADGFAKVIADKKTDDLLGVHMIGPHVTDYISEAALAQIVDATPWEVGMAIHPHPTLSEALGNAMLAVDGKAIDI
jgi:dihydrolipoamide dehydrogenase